MDEFVGAPDPPLKPCRPSTAAAVDCRAPAPARTSGKTIGERPRGSLQRDAPARNELRSEQGLPTLADPTMSLALPGAAPIGVPNFFIDKFRIPIFLLPIYQAAGIQYGVRWEVLAAINEIETDYGRNLNVSSAGALGWMQFMPATWKAYGVDANDDGRKDPFNPVDAIFGAARYLRAAGADDDLRKAIFAYNHADWYVEAVLMRARLIGGLPADLVGSLNGLTQGRFPVHARARYADDLSERRRARRAAIGENAALPIESDRARRGIDVFAAPGSPVVAVQDGRIVSVGRSERLGRFVRLADAYGNTYTYAHLKKIAARVPVLRPRTQSRAAIAKELALPKPDPKPTRAATAGRPTSRRPSLRAQTRPHAARAARAVVEKERLFAHPARPRALPHGGARQLREQGTGLAHGESLKSYLTGAFKLDDKDVVLKRLVRGRRVIAGTILGRIGTTSKQASPRMHFEIRPSGRGAPRIDPKPILDGWKLLEATAIYRARGRNPLVGSAAFSASIGQVMLMSKEALARRVLSDPRIEIYSCGRRDIEAGGIDRRVLATLAFLAAGGLRPTVTSLNCGHSTYTAGGKLSEHASGSAVDIAKLNGIPIVGHQGAGSITDIAIRRLLTLQGTMKPHQIISLMSYKGSDNTLALGDHADHIHVGFGGGTAAARKLAAVLKPSQWIKLVDRLGRIENPAVTRKPSKYAIRVSGKRASAAHRGE
ncbi:MAG: lytic murein transglycosylase [Solirubrobacteraceae bacterium]